MTTSGLRRLGASGLATLAVTASMYVLPAVAAARVRIQKIYFDSPGSDTGSNSSLNDEWIRLKNYGDRTKNLRNWTIKDRAGHRYTFGTYYLRPDATVHVHTGKGTNDGRHRFWGRSSYVWNNTGDRAYLRNSAGTLIDTCTFDGSGSYVLC